jgi:two-component system chemotaxis sensor kinase CheA
VEQPNEKVERDAETLEIFIEESFEGLDRIERLLLEAEQGRPEDDMLSIIFRDIHTVKGTSGFLALPRIEKLSHAAEDLLAKLRAETTKTTPQESALLLRVVDALRAMVKNVKELGEESDLDVTELVSKLRALCEAGVSTTSSHQHVDELVLERPMAQAAALQEVLQAPTKLGEILVERLSITPAQLQEALEVQNQRRGAAEGQPRAAEASDGTVRVSVGVLDRLMNLVGELVLARNQMVQIAKTVRDTSVNTQAAAQRLSLVTSDLQEQIMKTRMQPIARVFEKIPRMVRDLCTETGKKVECQIDGTATEIDKALVEAIRDPVMHIIRNAIDHGIEATAVRSERGKPPQGRVMVRANHEGGMVFIEIEDDGRGMDPQKMREHAVRKGLLPASQAERLSDREAIDLVFRPGFSTAEKVTNVSGRGVGMDVVRTHIERAGGQVELDTTVAKGTTVRLKMPLTLAIIPALLVSIGRQRFAIPQVNLLELVYLNEEQIRSSLEYVRGAPIYRLRGEVLPLVRLGSILQMTRPKESESLGLNIVVVGVGGRRYGLITDAIDDTEEIVIKPLHSQLKRLACYSGATVLGDGGVALILDVAGVASMANIDLSAKRETASEEARPAAGSGPQSMLVVTAGNDARCAVPLSMVSRLEVIESRKIERVAGKEVVQYRGTIIPVIRAESLLPLGDQAQHSEQHLVVFDFGRPVAMAVSSILDVVEVARENHQVDDAVPYTVGKTVIFGRTTLFIDVYAIVRELAPEFVRERRAARTAPRIVIADDSAAMRSALGSYLRACDLDVVEVSSAEAALTEARRGGTQRLDAVVTDLEMPGLGGLELIRMMKNELPNLPVLAWSFHSDPNVGKRAMEAGARAFVHKLEREALMTALAACGIPVGRSEANKPKELAA